MIDALINFVKWYCNTDSTIVWPWGNSSESPPGFENLLLDLGIIVKVESGWYFLNKKEYIDPGRVIRYLKDYIDKLEGKRITIEDEIQGKIDIFREENGINPKYLILDTGRHSILEDPEYGRRGFSVDKYQGLAVLTTEGFNKLEVY